MAGEKKIACQALLDNVGNYIDGELPQDLRISLEAHLAKCPDCWVLLDETCNTVEVVQETECHPLPEDTKQRLLATLRKSLGG